ncbi:LIM and senescent cell antigen-like-containing domain protein 2 isoform X2 [Folsomia candida]|uniref:LIM and senescent cell antigen-like-containing domain protein 2 isoform X2 n=1 Tax=Folsomia candida TaxID=158441 RepID=UPI000B8F497B|nr:LIM and senescent cell antigen-like-containing domain protein 2 isoform X2 [Folsomia candida]
MVKIKDFFDNNFRSLKRPTVVKDEVPHLPSRNRHFSDSLGSQGRSPTHSPSPRFSSDDSDDVTLDFAQMRLESPSSLQGYKECFACKMPVHEYWDEVFAMQKTWHSDCFHCGQCGKVLNPEKFMEKDGKPYCEHDYNQLFLPKCFSCAKTVFEVPVKALNRNYHLLCFTCKKCSQVLCPFTYYERKGSFYCEEDFHQLFSPKCYTCSEPIRDQKEMTKAMGGTFHKEHFVCCECAKPLPGNNYLKKNGNLYCEEDFHKVFSPKCAECNEPIRHDGILALGKKWHRDCCLRCATCKRILREDNYISEMDKAYCKSDWVKQFAPKCHDCGKGVGQVLTGDAVIALGRQYHPHCFYCKDCNLLLDERTYYSVDEEPYCQEHFHNRTCVDCLKSKEERKKALKKVVRTGQERTHSALSRRSMSPISAAFRSKSSQF